jgi:D-alanyl-D-alanine carboxypeptidase/D-alanyl-D-alanine-endopeptidase (penicillin-binding protein 4)
MSRARLVTLARVVSVVVLAAGAFTGVYFATHAVRDHPRGAATPVRPLPGAYRSATVAPSLPTGGSAPAPSPVAVRRVLAAVVHAPGLGARLRARVVDAVSGAVLYDRSGASATAPASTAKLLTAIAVLGVHSVTDRITTQIVAGPGRTVVLVGAGDPTLSGAGRRATPAYPHAARISDLAAQLRRAHLSPRGIVVDDSLFSGPTVSPAWAPEDVPSGYAAPITAVLADGGRAAPGDGVRSIRPDLDAGRELAAALGRPGLPVSRGAAPAAASVLATVDSAPYATLVAQMLQSSDNVIAECLARQVAIAEHRPASFTGAARAVRDVLTRLGVDPGAGMVDGSGLARRDRLSAATLAALLRLVTGTAHPALHAVVAALPVAAWSGTLAGRYLRGASRGAAGLVRAKTGSLTGVATLAGTVHDRSGRLLAFALMADRTGPTADAESALDAIVARLAACGCG